MDTNQQNVVLINDPIELRHYTYSEYKALPL